MVALQSAHFAPSYRRAGLAPAETDAVYPFFWFPGFQIESLLTARHSSQGKLRAPRATFREWRGMIAALDDGLTSA